MIKKYFGTDDIRGEVGQSPVTLDFVLELGYAAGQVPVQYDSEHRPTVLIGKDTRISGYMLEAALVVGFISAGVNVIQTGPLPTPGVVHLIRVLRLSAGVMVSASYNIYPDNGIKFFTEGGVKLGDEIGLEIEAKIDEEMKIQPSDQLGHARHINGVDDRYIEFCKSTLPNHPDSRGLRLVVGTANGAGYHVTPRVFHELGAQVVSIGDELSGYNTNEKCGAAYPRTLRAAILQNEVGYDPALDDDGDRLIMVDHNGKVYDGGSLVYVITRVRALEGIRIGGAVGMVMINTAMEITPKEQDVQFCRAKTSDRYVLEQFHQYDWLTDSEAGGYILCMNKHNAGDGIISALQVLAALRILGQGLTTVCAGWQPYPQTMIGVCIQKGQKRQGTSADVLVKVRKELEGRGRVVLRASGAEPVVRVMVGTKQTDWVKKGTERITAAIQDSEK